VIPTAAAGSQLTVDVGGITAVFADFTAVIGAKLPLFVAVVLGLSFALLVLVFRSLLIPLAAAVMNLLSAGAAFGVLTATFQWGWLGSLRTLGRIEIVIAAPGMRSGRPASCGRLQARLASA
jgi:RND superfamily putative drug exporter